MSGGFGAENLLGSLHATKHLVKIIRDPFKKLWAFVQLPAFAWWTIIRSLLVQIADGKIQMFKFFAETVVLTCLQRTKINFKGRFYFATPT